MTLNLLDGATPAQTPITPKVGGASGAAGKPAAAAGGKKVSKESAIGRAFKTEM